MVFMDYNPIGKTLRQVHMDVGSVFSVSGVNVFLLGEKDNDIHSPGKLVETDFSLLSILRKHPEYAEAKVCNYNDYYGESVFRVRLPLEEAKT